MGSRIRTSRCDVPAGERGTATVEFALVLPIILMLILGVMEFSLVIRDYVGVSNAVRDAARTASAQPRLGTVAGHAGPPAAQTQWSFAYNASQTLEQTGTIIPSRSIVDMWVFRANTRGFPEGTSDFSACPASTCVRYAWDVSDGTFKYRSGTWDPASINACPNDANAMAVGVFMRVRHRGLFNAFFNVNFDVTDSAVIKFEPMRPGPGSCRPV